MTSVLVTGASTPIGRRLCQELLDTGTADIVLAVARESEPPPGLRDLGGRIVYVRADITRERELRTLLFGYGRELGVEAIVHGSLHRSALDYGRHVRAINVRSTRLLLDLAEIHPTVVHFVFMSHADVYRINPWRPVLIAEQDPLDLSPSSPQRVRDRVEADLTVCARFALSKLGISVLRMAEVLAPESGSQLLDYLGSKVCFRPLGFDPMLNLLTVEDGARAVVCAVRSQARGVFNIAGADTLPLSRVIELSGRHGIAVPGPLLAPLYRARTFALGMEFRYDMNHRRFHFSAVLDARRAREELGYVPEHSIAWPAAAASASAELAGRSSARRRSSNGSARAAHA